MEEARDCGADRAPSRDDELSTSKQHCHGALVLAALSRPGITQRADARLAQKKRNLRRRRDTSDESVSSDYQVS